MLEPGSGVERRTRRWRSVAEKRRIVERTLEPGASVATVARAEGVNANQVFRWRRAFERGELVEPVSSAALVAVRIAQDVADGSAEEAHGCGSIHIEIPGRAMITVERGADPVLLRALLESFGR